MNKGEGAFGVKLQWELFWNWIFANQVHSSQTDNTKLYIEDLDKSEQYFNTAYLSWFETKTNFCHERALTNDQCEISFVLVDFWSISCLTFLLSPLLGCNSFPIRCCNGQEIQLGNCQQIQQASISSGNKSLAEFGNKSKSDDIEANNEAWDLIAVAGTISKSEWARRNLIAVSTLWIGLLLASPHQITLRQSLKLKLYGDQKGVTKRISSMQRGNKKPKKDALTWSKLLQSQE